MQNTLSPADVAVLSGNTGRSNDGFGDGNGAWWIILFLIFGYGRNGFGGFGGSNSGIGENYVLATDFATIERKIDSVNQGLCDGFYAMNTGMLNGFANTQQTLCQGFSGINQNIVTNGYETRNAISDLGYRTQDCCCKLQSQIADCCCTTQRAIDGINYNMATNTCAITNAINSGIRDIVDNQNANYRAIHDELVANRIEQKDIRIAELTAQVAKADDLATAQYIINKVKGCPEPAYIVPNPNCCYNYTVTQNSCGCGNY